MARPRCVAHGTELETVPAVADFMIPFCSVSQTVALERAAMQAGLSQATLMHKAGVALCRALLDFAAQTGRSRDPVLILAGPGNNGGDGMVCAAALQAQGRKVRIYAWNRPQQAPAALLGDGPGQVEYGTAREDPAFHRLRQWLAKSVWVVDCVLGTGSNRPIAGRLAALMTVVREGLTAHRFVVAADCPSGVDCDTGAVDPYTVPADLTVMFGTAKRGLYQSPAREFAGRIVVADIGLSPVSADQVTGWGLETPDLPQLLPHRSDQSHKGTFGKALCIVGSRRYPGAAHLSAWAAARSGAGVVCAAVPASVQQGLVSGMPDITFLPYRDTAGTASPQALVDIEREASRHSAILVGCGLSHTPHTIDFVRGFLERRQYLQAGPRPVVLDADALNCLATLAQWPRLLPPDAILTPHLAEMGRLCGLQTSEVQVQAPELARAMAQVWNCTVLLKGPQTWIGTPQGKLFAILNANSALATAGTGDVLAGLTVGLLAQGQNPGRAAQAAALLHAVAGEACAREVGPAGTTASDVLARIPPVLRHSAPSAARHRVVRHHN